MLHRLRGDGRRCIRQNSTADWSNDNRLSYSNKRKSIKAVKRSFGTPEEVAFRNDYGEERGETNNL